jgi:hypothetical protein
LAAQAALPARLAGPTIDACAERNHVVRLKAERVALLEDRGCPPAAAAGSRRLLIARLRRLLGRIVGVQLLR